MTLGEAAGVVIAGIAVLGAAWSFIQDMRRDPCRYCTHRRVEHVDGLACRHRVIEAEAGLLMVESCDCKTFR